MSLLTGLCFETGYHTYVAAFPRKRQSGIAQSIIAVASGVCLSAGAPDPDLIIRTSGEKRISNFLLWQCAYSEFDFPEILWPDFNKKRLIEAVERYNKRDRRFGGVKEE